MTTPKAKPRPKRAKKIAAPKLHEATVEWVFDAPIERVWRAWTVAELFAQWFGTPPYQIPVDRVMLNVVEGGEWHATMVNPNGDELPFQGTYIEIVPQKRLIMTFENVNDLSDEKVEILTATFEERGEQTGVVVHQAGHLPASEYPKLEAGYKIFMDRLAKLLATMG